MNFDIRPFESQCVISDAEWNMIMESGSFIKLKNCYYTIYKNHIITFMIYRNGLVQLLQKRRKPCKNYILPVLTIDMNFSQRVAVYKEERRLLKGLYIDEENLLKYGT